MDIEEFRQKVFLELLRSYNEKAGHEYSYVSFDELVPQLKREAKEVVDLYVNSVVPGKRDQ